MNHVNQVNHGNHGNHGVNQGGGCNLPKCVLFYGKLMRNIQKN